MQKNRKLKRNINILLSFLMSIFLFMVLMLTITYFTLLYMGSIKNKLRRVDYYQGIQELILDNSRDILLPTGLPEDILDGVIGIDDVSMDMERYIEASLSGNSNEIDAEEIREKLTANIKAYVAEQKLDRTAVSEEAITEVVDTLVDEYLVNVKFPFMNQLAKIEKLMRTGTIVVSIGSLIFVLIIILILSKMNRPIHRKLRLFSHSAGAAGLMLLVMPLVIRISGVYKRIQLTPRFAYEFMVLHVEGWLNALITAGITLLVLYAVLVVLSYSKYKKLVSR